MKAFSTSILAAFEIEFTATKKYIADLRRGSARSMEVLP